MTSTDRDDQTDLAARTDLAGLVADYERDGAVVVRGALSAEQVALATAGI